MFYQDRGYAYATVLPLTKLDLAARTVTLIYEIDPGEISFFEGIDVVGNDHTSADLIRDELGIVAGQRFHATRLDEGRRRLERLGYFRSVDIATQRGATPNTVRVGFVTIWRFDAAPTSTSPSAFHDTIEGVVRPPSWLWMTTGSPPSRTETHEFVVPRSIPMIRPKAGPTIPRAHFLKNRPNSPPLGGGGGARSATSRSIPAAPCACAACAAAWPR